VTHYILYDAVEMSSLEDTQPPSGGRWYSYGVASSGARSWTALGGPSFVMKSRAFGEPPEPLRGALGSVAHFGTAPLSSVGFRVLPETPLLRPISYGLPGVLLNCPSSLQNHFHQPTEEQHHKIKHELVLFFVGPAFTAGLRAHCSVVSNARSRQ
jgi:hypothetical protein